jgi:hypothetical protein
VPAVLLIVPGMKKVKFPPCFSRFPSVTESTSTLSGLNPRLNCAPATGTAGSTIISKVNVSPGSTVFSAGETLTMVTVAPELVQAPHKLIENNKDSVKTAKILIPLLHIGRSPLEINFMKKIFTPLRCHHLAQLSKSIVISETFLYENDQTGNIIA